MAPILDPRRMCSDLCEIARSVDSRRELHDAWLDVLAPIGFDRALVLDDTMTPGPLSSLASRNPLTPAFELARRDAARYLADYPKLRSQAASSGDVTVISAEDRWFRVFQEQFVPRGERFALMILLHARGRPLCVITLSRDQPASRFHARHHALAVELAPVLSIADFAWARAETPEPPAVASLSARERDIATLIGKGLTNSEIATVVGSSPNTVRNQITSIFRKLGVSTRAELAGLR